MATILVCDTNKQEAVLAAKLLLSAGNTVFLPQTVDDASRMVAEKTLAIDMALVDFDLETEQHVAGVIAACIENKIPVLVNTQHDELDWETQMRTLVEKYLYREIAKEDILEVRISRAGSTKECDLEEVTREFIERFAPPTIKEIAH